MVEAQARAGDPHGALVEDPAELLEQLGKVLVADAKALVVNRQLGPSLLVGKGDHGYVAAPRRVFHRVVEQVVEGLAEAAAIGPHHHPGLHPQAQGMLAAVEGELVHHLGDELGQTNRLEVVAELLGVDPVDGGEVLDQGGRCLIDFFAAFRKILRQVAVVVPIAMEQLDEADAALRQTPGEQTIRRECSRRLRVFTVELEGVFGFLRQIGELRHRALHLVRHLVLDDAGGNLRVAELLELNLVELTPGNKHL